MTDHEDPIRLSEAASGAPQPLQRLIGQARADLPSAQQMARVAAGLGPLTAPVAAKLLIAKLAAAAVIGGAAIGGGVWVVRSPASAVVPVARSVARPWPVPAAAPAPPADPDPITAPSVQPETRRPGPMSEAALLGAAQAALRSDPGRALALVQEHRRRFAGGALVQEREVIAIEALSRLGRTDEARSRARGFEQAYPGSAHRRKVGSTVSGE
jgi:hypothetical protein